MHRGHESPLSAQKSPKRSLNEKDPRVAFAVFVLCRHGFSPFSRQQHCNTVDKRLLLVDASSFEKVQSLPIVKGTSLEKD